MLVAIGVGPQLDWLIELVVGSFAATDEEEVASWLAVALLSQCVSLFGALRTASG